MRSTTLPMLVTTCVLIYVAYKLVHLQQSQGDALRARAERQQTVSYTVPAQRGDILDGRGRVLAGSVRRPSVFADPSLVRDYLFESIAVADALGMNAAALERDLRAAEGRRFMWIRRDVSPEAEKALRSLKERFGQQLRAFGIQYEPKRIYPAGRLAAHVLGFVTRDGHERGQEGIELQFNRELSGQPGRRYWTAAERRRQRVRRLDDRFEPPVDGATVVLTIDTHIQESVEKNLHAARKQFNGVWAQALVLDALTGEVLALAISPDFDPAQPVPAGMKSEVAADRRRNRLVTDMFEPGSIFKQFVVGPAVDAGLSHLDEVYEIGGTQRRFGARIVNDTRNHQRLTLSGVVSESSNIGMALLGQRCGNPVLHEFVRRFGFGELTGIDLPGEVPGMVRNLRDWNNYSTQSIPFGQEIGVTGMQIAAAFAVFANDGVLLRPRIVRGVVASNGETLHDNSAPIPIRRVMSVEAARELRVGPLAEAVRSGTGTKAQLPDYSIFGKTGTAEVARTGGGGYLPQTYIGSFVCGAPVYRPRIVVLVSMYLTDKPKQYYGGTVAAPAAALIVAETLDYLGVPRDLPDRMEVGAAPGRREFTLAAGG